MWGTWCIPIGLGNSKSAVLGECTFQKPGNSGCQNLWMSEISWHVTYEAYWASWIFPNIWYSSNWLTDNRTIYEHAVGPQSYPLTLLEVLPKLYNYLLSYPQSLAQLNECGVPSMRKYFLDPLQKETSPYGVEVCKYIVVYLEECDMDLMNR